MITTQHIGGSCHTEFVDVFVTFTVWQSPPRQNKVQQWNDLKIALVPSVAHLRLRICRHLYNVNTDNGVRRYVY